MKKILVLTLLLFPVYWLSAQGKFPPNSSKRTYPIDSCLYVISPTNMLVDQLTPTGSGGVVRVFFRSAASAPFMFQGKGRFYLEMGALPPGVNLQQGSVLQALLAVPDRIGSPGGAENGLPGGNLPFPIMLNGFLTKVDGTVLDPALPLGVQANRLQVDSTE